MPVTQHLWTWDRFLHGGHDFELTTLTILSILSLVLVLTKQCKEGFKSLLSTWRILAFNLDDHDTPRTCFPGEFPAMCLEHVTGPNNGIFNFPLQI